MTALPEPIRARHKTVTCIAFFSVGMDLPKRVVTLFLRMVGGLNDVETVRAADTEGPNPRVSLAAKLKLHSSRPDRTPFGRITGVFLDS